MEIFGNIFNTIFFAPIVNLVIFLVRIFESANIPGALGWSIVAMTVLIRLIVWPLISAQLKSARKMAELKPHLDEIKQKHDKDKQAYALAQAELFKQHGYNPAAGCLPTLVQIPVFIALYQAISALFNGQSGLEHINYFLYSPDWKLTQAPDPFFMGLNLASKPSDFMSAGWYVLSVPFVTALLQFIQSKMMLSKAVKEYPSDSLKEKKEKESMEDAMAGMQSQMVYLMPIMIGYFAFSFPIGLALYWNIFSSIGIYQQYKLAGWGGMEAWMSKIGIKPKTQVSSETKVRVEKLKPLK